MFYLYLILNTVNSKMYVGITNNPNKRWARHKSDAKSNRKQAIHCAIYKYGEEKFLFKIAEQLSTWEEANQKEMEWIKFLKENYYQLYNETEGGDGVYGTKWTDERKQKMRELNAGEGNPMYGVQLFGEANGNYGKKMKTHVKEKLLSIRSKITEEQVKEMRSLYATGNYKQTDLCRKYNLSAAQVCRILRGTRWQTS